MNIFAETSYNQLFVIASYALSVLGSYLSLSSIDKLLKLKEIDLPNRINKQLLNENNIDANEETKNQKTIYFKNLFVSSVAFGGLAVWSMHFMGQVALRIPTEINYDAILTLTSFLVVTLTSFIALHIVISKPNNLISFLISGIILGLGVISMHYIGMYSMRFDGFFILNTEIVIISIAIALIVSPAALWIACRARSLKTRLIAAFIMGGGISAVHYIGTSAAGFICN